MKEKLEDMKGKNSAGRTGEECLGSVKTPWISAGRYIE
jgi:hypothetical protein